MRGRVRTRPLSVVEIFDRAVMVYVKNWRRFTLLAVILRLPGTWIDYVRTAAKGQNVGTAGSHTTVQTLLDHVLATTFGTGYQHNYVGICASIAVSILVTLAVYPAFLCGLRSVDEDRPMGLPEWLASGWHRFDRLLGVTGVWVIVALGAAIACGILFIPVVLLPSFFGPVDLYVVCLGIALIVVAPGLCIAYYWSLFIATDEDTTSGATVLESVSRVLRPSRFWRTVGISYVLAVVVPVVGSVLGAAMWALFLWTESALLNTVLDYLVSLPLTAYSGLVVAIYFLDSRLRDGRPRGTAI